MVVVELGKAIFVNIIYMGTPGFAVPALRRRIDLDSREFGAPRLEFIVRGVALPPEIQPGAQGGDLDETAHSAVLVARARNFRDRLLVDRGRGGS